MEKVAVAKDLYKQQEDNGKPQKLPDLSLTTEDVMGQSIDLEALQAIPLHSYYYENVFSVEDLYLYRAVFHFFAGDYQHAIEGYEHC